MKTSHSNVSVRSNVFIRVSLDPAEDEKFLSQVRGRGAILKLLHRIAPDQDNRRAALKYLSKNQLAEVAWQAPCAICGALPEGPVTGTNALEIQFRCPRGTCPAGNVIPRAVLLDIHLIRGITEKFGKTLPEILPSALQMHDQMTQRSLTPGPTQAHANRRRVVVLLSRSQYHFLSDADIESALNELFESNNVIG
jgi:hypothetical protein